MRSVLFVCSANICRSPLAMGLFMARLGADAAVWRVESAGNWDIEGEPVARNSHMILLERGINLGNHRSRSVNLELLRSFNLILTMEQGHKEALQIEFPDIADRVFLLSEMTGKIYDIQDPIGGYMADFQQTASEFDQIFTQGFEKINQLAEDR